MKGHLPMELHSPRSDKYLEKLRSSLKTSGYILNDIVFEGAKQFFFACNEGPSCVEILRKKALEYDKTEFFLNVDSKGLAIYPPVELMEDFRMISDRYKDFQFWLREEKDQENKGTTLLVARWLSHLVGFRHRCAHIFLDHPILDGYTFVQLRSFDKLDYPGCFDIPIGGHAEGIERIEETAKRELKQELNLDIEEDIEDFKQIGNYDYCEPSSNPDFYNIEHRTVFRGRLKTKAISKIKFIDGEVAGICLFITKELTNLLKKFPERAASGLVGSFPIYLQQKKNEF